jgi:hypothetical protein
MNIETVLKMSVVICCKQQRFAIAEVFGLLNVGSICGRHRPQLLFRVMRLESLLNRLALTDFL